MAHEPSGVFGVRARFRVVSPLFLAGASSSAELRAPSVKAALRFWYRAVDPGFCRAEGSGQPIRESALWGGAERYAGQSLVSLAVTEQSLQTQRWKSFDWRRFDEGQGRRRKNGVAYLGYPFGFKEHQERTAIVPDSTFSLRASLFEQRGVQPWQLQGLAASLWMLGHLGALGSRSRRGFGSLSLVDWDTFGVPPAELVGLFDDLPLLSAASGRDAWISRSSEVRATLRNWFGDYPDDTKERFAHPHFGEGTRVALSERAFGGGQSLEALNMLGRRLQDFRVRREPDYTIAKDHLLAKARAGGRFMGKAPGRITFGLPLSFRFGSLKTLSSELTLVPRDDRGQSAERQPSLLLARLVQLGDGLHPLFLRLSGSVPGIDTSVGDRRDRRGGLLANENALDAFMDSLE